MTVFSAEAGPPPVRAARLRFAVRLLALGLIAAGAIAAWRWRGFFDPPAIAAAIAGYPAAPVIFLAVHIVASLLFVPRTLLAMVAGLLFGMGWGLCWAALGSVGGAVAGFLVARYLSSGPIDAASVARIRPVLDKVERGGWRGVAFLRLIPVVPHSLGNYALGLTRLRLGPYAAGFAAGTVADDDRLCRSGYGRRPTDAGGRRLARTEPDWRRRTRALAAGPRDGSPAVPLMVPQHHWHRAAGGPVEKLDSMHDWNRRLGGKLDDTADIAGGDEFRTGPGDVGEFALAQP